MVDLLAAGSSRRAAVLKAAGDSLKPETLRKHYRELESSEQLPPPSVSREARKKALKAAFQKRADQFEEAKQELAAAEERARALGLNLDDDLDRQIEGLRRHQSTLFGIVNIPAESQMHDFDRRGIRDPEEAARLLAQDEDDLEVVEKRLSVLRTVRHLRDIVRSVG